MDKPERIRFMIALKDLAEAALEARSAFQSLSEKDQAAVQDSLSTVLLGAVPGANLAPNLMN